VPVRPGGSLTQGQRPGRARDRSRLRSPL